MDYNPRALFNLYKLYEAKKPYHFSILLQMLYAGRLGQTTRNPDSMQNLSWM
jgi:hypothetical protein